MAKLRLEEILKRKKISRRGFARLIKTDPGTAARYFKSGYNPTLTTLEKWAKALGVRIRDLIQD